MDAAKRERLGKGYLGQLIEALADHDANDADAASRGLEKQFLMVQRTLQRILTSLMPLVLDQFRARHGELFATLRKDVEAGRWREADERRQQIQSHHQEFHDMYVNWFASLLTAFVHAYGEDALAELLRVSGLEFTKDFERWDTLSPEELVEASVFLQLAHPGGKLRIEEDEEKYSLVQEPCGTGGRLLDEGKYEGERPYARFTQARAETAGHEGLPAYCAHCTVWNTLLTTEQHGAPHWVIRHPIHSSCTIHIYKDRARTPTEYLRRLRTGGAGEEG